MSVKGFQSQYMLLQKNKKIDLQPGKMLLEGHRSQDAPMNEKSKATDISDSFSLSVLV